MFCSNCGKEININDEYCRYCGYKNHYYKQLDIEDISIKDKIKDETQNNNTVSGQNYNDKEPKIVSDNEPLITKKEKKSSYIIKHWRGQLPLGISYWINTILANIILYYISYFLIKNANYSNHPVLSSIIGISYWVMAYLISTWSLVGLWRSAENHIRKYKKRLWANIVQLIVIIALLQGVYTFFKYGLPQMKVQYNIAFNKGRIPAYKISVLGNGVELEISGGIRFGLTNEVKHYFQKYPNIKIIRLNSMGGRIAEAHKLAAYLKGKNLITYSSKECNSACVDVFMAGKYRLLNEKAYLGFHRPFAPGILKSALLKAIEQEKQYFINKGVNINFVNKAFNTPFDKMWEPSHNRLLKLGIVDFIVKNPVSGVQDNIDLPLIDNPTFKVLQKYKPKDYDRIVSVIIDTQNHNNKPDRLQTLYDNLLQTKKVSQKDIGDFDTFKKGMAGDSASVHRFYNNLIKAGISDNDIGDWNMFYENTQKALNEQGKLSVPEFAKSIKEKYPQYQDINDTTLVTKILEKYPQYKNRVDFDGNQAQTAPKVASQKIKIKKEVSADDFTTNLENGKKVYNKVCIACHMTGVIGAPALKDKARWEEIAAKGMKQLHNDVINGFTGKHGVMPARGTCNDCSDHDLYDAVSYMLKTAGVTTAK